MNQSLQHVALVVRDYDEAIRFFCETLHFRLVEDTCQREPSVAPYGTVSVFKDLYGNLWDLIGPK